MIKISPEILPILGGDRCPPGFQTLPRSAAQGAVHADGLVACEAPILQEASVPLRASLGWLEVVRPSESERGIEQFYEPLLYIYLYVCACVHISCVCVICYYDIMIMIVYEVVLYQQGYGCGVWLDLLIPRRGQRHLRIFFVEMPRGSHANKQTSPNIITKCCSFCGAIVTKITRVKFTKFTAV